MISKDNHFEIWFGSENGNKYERVITKDNVENSKINYFYNSLLPTDVSYEKPFGIELMSAFYIGKSQEEVEETLSKDMDNLVSVYGSEMTNDVQSKLRGKNAFSIYFGLSSPTAEQVFKCSKFWSSDVVQVKTNSGKEMYLGLSSFYVDYFVGYVTTNLSKWIKEFFEENKEQFKSPDLKVEEIINEKNSIVSQKDNQHLNLRIQNAKFEFTDLIEKDNGEKYQIETAMSSFYNKKVRNHYLKYKEIENSAFKNYKIISDWDDNDKTTEKHYNGGYRIIGSNNEKWERNDKIYIKIDFV
ncbi:hypothetical protein [Spiroplasma floricola]|uniref:Uncharacterized protein n=1 Tax=Spiroplasma floricola 23-6 TaxID=1336749 RepID=A0A2K8SDF4_9MOLU|nr:hypothetical protein [Spiroplasma floricola]AUB31494.1 hypothetical protein SFLOR_v1c04420 [Spiroplasma floricola 23-6]